MRNEVSREKIMRRRGWEGWPAQDIYQSDKTGRPDLKKGYQSLLIRRTV
jgi:hypothetical protein